MKQFILFILVLLPVCAFAQFTETFDGPILNAGWIGGRDSFLIEGGQLKLNAPGGKSGIASLKHIIPYASNMQWEFEAQINTNPSDNNNVRIALYDEGGIYYYVQIGFAGKNKIGFRRSKQKDMFERQENNWGNKTHLAIKVTLEDNKYWTMYSRQINETYYKLEGSCTYPIIAAKDSGYFLINIIYTGGRNKHFLLDNIYVSDKITPTVTEPSEDPEDPSKPDITLPKLLSIEPLTLSDLQFVFDLPVKTEQAAFSISDIGNADRIVYADESRKVVNTHYPEEMKTGEIYTISYSGVTDEKGNTLDSYSEKVKVEEEDEGEEPSESGSILILSLIHI